MRNRHQVEIPPHSIPLIALLSAQRSNSLFDQIDSSEFDVHFATKTVEITQSASEFGFSVVLLEPDGDQASISTLCERLAQNDCVVTIVISTSECSAGRLDAWRHGADLVLSANVSVDEILMSCRRMSRLFFAKGPNSVEPYFRNQTSWQFESQSFRLIHQSGTWIKLSRNEAQVMTALCKSSNRLVRRNVLWKLLDKADWRYNDRSLDVLIARIRAKMKKVKIDPNVILTHYGAGYELRINS